MRAINGYFLVGIATLKMKAKDQEPPQNKI